MSHVIYLVEDDENLNKVLTSYLEKEGYKVYSFLNGEDALKYLHKIPDLWILDIMLPDIDGYQLIKRIKEVSNVPVIFISARDADIDRVVGLELGSEDYLAKPFLPRELVIRVKNLLSRTKGQEAKTIQLKPYSIDPNSRVVTKDGETIELSSKEFSLTMMFAENLNIALSREQILNEVWGDDYFGSDRVVDDLVRRLRKKLTDLDIVTIYGYGYRVSLR